jgi:branched-chain amino acid transport system permease protein
VFTAVLADVLALAPLYGTVALGFVIIYRFTGVLNLAQGALFAVGAYVFYVASEVIGIPFVAALLLVTILGFVFGLALYATLFRPLSGRSVLAIILVTIAFGAVVQGALILLFTARPYSLKALKYLEANLLTLPGGHHVPSASVIMLVVYFVLLIGLGSLFTYLTAGMRGRAAGENPVLASYRGIRVHWVFAMAWAIAACTAFLSGSIYILNHQLSPNIAEVALHGFAAAMVGGLDSISGTLLGAVIVAAGVSIAFQYVNPLLSDVMPYVIMFIVLYVRPWGMWGSPEMIDRV